MSSDACRPCPAPTGSPLEAHCGDCRLCAEICPADALKGRAFNPDEPRDLRLDASVCDRRLLEIERETGFHACGLCLYVCPFGRTSREPVSAV